MLRLIQAYHILKLYTSHRSSEPMQWTYARWTQVQMEAEIEDTRSGEDSAVTDSCIVTLNLKRECEAYV